MLDLEWVNLMRKEKLLDAARIFIRMVSLIISMVITYLVGLISGGLFSDKYLWLIFVVFAVCWVLLRWGMRKLERKVVHWFFG